MRTGNILVSGDVPSNLCALMRNESLIVYLTRVSANGVFITRNCAHWCAIEIIALFGTSDCQWVFFITIFSLGLKKVLFATEWMKKFILSFWSYPFLDPIAVETHVLIWVVREGVENNCRVQMLLPLGKDFSCEKFPNICMFDLHLERVLHPPPIVDCSSLQRGP